MLCMCYLLNNINNNNNNHDDIYILDGELELLAFCSPRLSLIPYRNILRPARIDV